MPVSTEVLTQPELNDPDFIAQMEASYNPTASNADYEEYEPAVIEYKPIKQKVKYPDQLTPILKGEPKGFYKMWLNAHSGVSAVSKELKLIGALSLQAQSLHGLSFKHGHKDMSTNMYFMGVAESGEGKSTVLDWVNSYNYLITGQGRIGANFTPEGVEQKLIDNPRLFIGIDEYQEFADVSNKSYGAGLRSFITSVYSGRLFPSLRKERLKDGESTDPVDVNVNILAMTTYEWMEGLDYSAFRSGELARWIIIPSPGTEERIAMPQPVSPENHENIKKWVRAFSEKCYGTATFSQGAEYQITKQYNALLDRIEAMPKAKRDIFIALGKRLDLSARKLSVLLECNDEPRACPEVKEENVIAAYEVINNIITMYEMKIEEGLFGTSEQVAAFRVTRYLEEHGEATEMDLQSVTEMSLAHTNALLKSMVKSAKVRLVKHNNGEVEVYIPYNRDQIGEK
jgi:hypothetical protein